MPKMDLENLRYKSIMFNDRIFLQNRSLNLNSNMDWKNNQYPNKYFVLKNIISFHVDKQNFAAHLTLRKGQTWVMSWCGKQPDWNLNNKTKLVIASDAWILFYLLWLIKENRTLEKKHNLEINSEQV